MSDTNIAKLTASQIPDVVLEAFSKMPALTMRDVLLLESVGVKFIATGAAPSLYELTALYWLVTARDSFEKAADAETFRQELYAWAKGIPPHAINAAAVPLAGLIKRSFAPMEDGSKKPLRGKKS